MLHHYKDHAWTHQRRWPDRHTGDELIFSFCRREPCVWFWLWCHVATFVTTSQGVKVLHKTRPAHMRHLKKATVAFPSLLLPAALHGYGLWEKLHVLCGMICNFPVSPALTVLSGFAEEKYSRVKRCACSLFGQWVLILGLHAEFQCRCLFFCPWNTRQMWCGHMCHQISI